MPAELADDPFRSDVTPHYDHVSQGHRTTPGERRRPAPPLETMEMGNGKWGMGNGGWEMGNSCLSTLHFANPGFETMDISPCPMPCFPFPSFPAREPRFSTVDFSAGNESVCSRRCWAGPTIDQDQIPLGLRRSPWSGVRCRAPMADVSVREGLCPLSHRFEPVSPATQVLRLRAGQVAMWALRI